LIFENFSSSQSQGFANGLGWPMSQSHVYVCAGNSLPAAACSVFVNH